MPLLVVQLPQGTTFLLSSRLDSAVKRCSIVDYARLAAAVKYYSPAERLGRVWPEETNSEVLIRSELVGVAKLANN